MPSENSKNIKSITHNSYVRLSAGKSQVRSSFDLKIPKARGVNFSPNSKTVRFLGKEDYEAVIDELMSLVDYGQAINERYVEVGAERCLRLVANNSDLDFLYSLGLEKRSLDTANPDQPTQSNYSTTHPNPPTSEEKHGGER